MKNSTPHFQKLMHTMLQNYHHRAFHSFKLLAMLLFIRISEILQELWDFISKHFIYCLNHFRLQFLEFVNVVTIQDLSEVLNIWEVTRRKMELPLDLLICRIKINLHAQQKERQKQRETNLSKFIFQILYKSLLGLCFAHHCRHLLFKVTNYIGVNLSSSCSFHKFIYLQRGRPDQLASM